MTQCDHHSGFVLGVPVLLCDLLWPTVAARENSIGLFACVGGWGRGWDFMIQCDHLSVLTLGAQCYYVTWCGQVLPPGKTTPVCLYMYTCFHGYMPPREVSTCLFVHVYI